MPKKALVALPAGLLEQVDFVAQVEHRTRSDLIREALRRYIETFRRGCGQVAPIVADPVSPNPYHKPAPVTQLFNPEDA